MNTNNTFIVLAALLVLACFAEAARVQVGVQTSGGSSLEANKPHKQDGSGQVIIRNQNLLKNKAEKRNKGSHKENEETMDEAIVKDYDNTIPNLKGTCAFAKECPSGWQSSGVVGLIMMNQYYNKNPFHEGGYHSYPQWRWTHPRLCCATSDQAMIRGLYTLSNQCPPSSESFGIVGAIHRVDEYQLQPFNHLHGGHLNAGWRWTHPALCSQTGANAELSKSLNCVLAKECPTDFNDRGTSGIIIVNHDIPRSLFSPGGAYNGGWTWIHPKLCCTQ